MEEGRERLLEVPGDLEDTSVEVVELLEERGAHVWRQAFMISVCRKHNVGDRAYQCHQSRSWGTHPRR